VLGATTTAFEPEFIPAFVAPLECVVSAGIVEGDAEFVTAKVINYI
jgi:hypothetical protein